MKKWTGPLPIDRDIIDKTEEGEKVVGSATITFAGETVLAKAKACGVIAKEPVKGDSGKPILNADGTPKMQPIRVPVPVRSTHLKVMVPGVGEITARSCCKPPDTFDQKTGIELAARRALKDPRIPKSMHRILLKNLCPWVLKGRSLVKQIKDVKAIQPTQA